MNILRVRSLTVSRTIPRKSFRILRFSLLEFVWNIIGNSHTYLDILAFIINFKALILLLKFVLRMSDKLSAKLSTNFIIGLGVLE